MKRSKLSKANWRTGYGTPEGYPGGPEVVKSTPRPPARSDSAVVRLTNGQNGMSSGVGKKMTRGPKYPTSAT